MNMNMNGIKEKRKLPIPEAPPVMSADKPGLISITTIIVLLLLLLLQVPSQIDKTKIGDAKRDVYSSTS